MFGTENVEALRAIAKTSFYGALGVSEANLVHTKLTQPIDQADLTVIYTSFGNVPEPRQLSPTVASSGTRQAKALRDYKLTGTVVEWEQTVYAKRSTIETNPNEIPRITQQMAEKAMLFMDRRFVADILPSTTALGYDGIALYNASHAESGTNQDNDLTSAAATGTAPTPAEIEAQLDINIQVIKQITDDEGTPVNAGVSEYLILVPASFEFLYKAVLHPVNVQNPTYDASSGTGRFRGMFEVFGSPFVATEDRHYVFAKTQGTQAVGLLKNKDFEFTTNIGTDSDLWNLHQTAVFSSYARWEFVPWDWKRTVRHVWT